MPKVDDLTRIRAELRAEKEAKNKKNLPWTIFWVLLLAGVFIYIAMEENTPEARKARYEKNSNEARKLEINAETEKNFKLFKEAEEFQKRRPLNSVEEQAVKDYARKAAEQRVPR